MPRLPSARPAETNRHASRSRRSMPSLRRYITTEAAEKVSAIATGPNTWAEPWGSTTPTTKATAAKA